MITVSSGTVAEQHRVSDEFRFPRNRTIDESTENPMNAGRVECRLTRSWRQRMSMECVPEIRPAAESDWETIAEFNRKLAEETEPHSLDRETVEAGVKAVLADQQKGRYFVAVLQGRIVGQLMHTREWSDWRNGEVWWLQSVYVDADLRRQGIFAALYQHLKRLAEAEPAVVGLRLYVERENERAQSTYRKLGFESAGYLVMERMFGRL